jgi:hypothetical protein
MNAPSVRCNFLSGPRLCSGRNKLLDQIAMNVWEFFFNIFKIATKVFLVVGHIMLNCLLEKPTLLFWQAKPTNTRVGFNKTRLECFEYVATSSISYELHWLTLQMARFG